MIIRFAMACETRTNVADVATGLQLVDDLQEGLITGKFEDVVVKIALEATMASRSRSSKLSRLRLAIF